jgi:GrpB-like predicted nucleotidyltransferase (UPF0157 family)
MVETEGDLWRRYLLFRDSLQRHPDVARDYDTLKRGLAARFRDDREAYTRGKADFVEAVLSRALVERAAG